MAEADMLRIGSMILDPARACLRREDGTEIALRPKSLDLLVVLARSAGRVVTRDALLDAIWPNIFVNSDSVAQCVQDVRRALGDSERRMLRTVPKRGYVLDVEVTSIGPTPRADTGPFTEESV